MFTTFHPRASASKGFSLVEIMVGMVIGLLSMLVILQVFSVFETQKRTSTGGSDAQSTGAIALYGLQRDIRQSGYGISSYNLFGCNVLLPLPSAATVPLAPVTIYPSGTVAALFPVTDPNTDRILIMYGNGNGVPQGDGITSQVGNVYTASTPGAYTLNDKVIAQSQVTPAPCNLAFDRITAIPAAGAAGPVTVATGVAGVASGTLFNLGQAPRVLAYAIIGGNLQVCNYMAANCAILANWVPIASNIVSMRVQYGRDTTVNGAFPTMDGIVDQFDQVPPATACDRARISAIRIALVARNIQRSPAATPAAPTWAGSAVVAPTPANPIANPTATPIDLSNDPNWMNYRYKVFQTIVPLKNMIWMGLPC